MLAVTFTNKAAEEMRQRVELLFGGDCSRMWISTFHSLCARLLRREAPAIGLSRDFVIYDSSDQLSVVKQALRDLQIDDSFVQPRAALSRISQRRTGWRGPTASTTALEPARRADRARSTRYYVSALENCNALDFDDLLLKTVHLFEKSPPSAPGTPSSSGSSWWTNTRTRTGRNTCSSAGSPSVIAISASSATPTSRSTSGAAPICGTSWISSTISRTRIVRLERNYRSTQMILDAASAVISQNRNRKEKRLWTDRKGGARILYFRGGDELEEADFIMRPARRHWEDPEHWSRSCTAPTRSRAPLKTR